MTVYSDNDMTMKENENQRKIREVTERNKGKASCKSICYMKLTVSGEMWRWDEEKGNLRNSHESKN